jgi:hypothetical protein
MLRMVPLPRFTGEDHRARSIGAPLPKSLRDFDLPSRGRFKNRPFLLPLFTPSVAIVFSPSGFVDFSA